MEGLSEEERRALRGSKFAPLPPPPSSSSSSSSLSIKHQQQKPRLAHPGGPLVTNKAAALSKFLERKLQHPLGLSSIDPHLVQSAIQNAKRSLSSSGASSSGTIIHHVTSFGDSEPEDSAEKEGKVENISLKKHKKKKMLKKNKNTRKQKIVDDSGDLKLKKPKKKLKL